VGTWSSPLRVAFARFAVGGLIRGFEAVRFVADPRHKFCDVRVGAQRFQRVVIALQHFLREQRVDVVMAGPTQPREPMLHLMAIKDAMIPFVRMPRLGDQVMLRHHADRAFTQFTKAGFFHSGVPILIRKINFCFKPFATARQAGIQSAGFGLRQSSGALGEASHLERFNLSYSRLLPVTEGTVSLPLGREGWGEGVFADTSGYRFI
jgi:hypothetical protein